ncbi:hypothetical protein ARMGADRAFT_423167 [Armillaria gallica]|uniref:Uncharacterized protein n=1 Tax=Armillaria gallica TaxID=47427 RepID=A0A2H3E5E9_ARMGA|nr:hypothetical protein ARMGADRAFT_423167 [Armillaria gallica]
MPSPHLFKTLLLQDATNSSISHQWIVAPSPGPCRTTLKSTLFFLLAFQNQQFSITSQLIVTLKESWCYDAIPLTTTTLPLQRWIKDLDTLFNQLFVVPSNGYLSRWHNVSSTIYWNGKWTMRMYLVAMCRKSRSDSTRCILAIQRQKAYHHLRLGPREKDLYQSRLSSLGQH